MSYFARPSLGGTKSLMSMSGNLHKKATSYCFPILNYDEIVASLIEVGIPVDEEDLVKARPDVIRNVYEKLLCIVMGVSGDDIYQPKYSGIDALKFEELHEESVPTVHFMRYMNKLLLACAVDEGYTIRELIKPDPMRVRRNLSAVINFHKYREEKMSKYAQFAQKTEELVRLKEQLEAEKAAYQHKIREVRGAVAAEEPAAAALRGEIESLSERKEGMENRLARVVSAANEQRDAAKAIRDALAMADQRIEVMRGDIETKRGQIVSSPNRIKSDVDAAARQVEEAKSVLSLSEEARRAMQRRLDVTAKADKDLRKVLSLLDELEGELSRLKKAAKDVKGRQSDAEAIQAEIASLQEQADHMTKAAKRAEERVMDLKGNRSLKEEAASRATAAMRQELVAVLEETAAVKEAKRTGEMRRAELEHHRDRALQKHSEEMAEMLSGIKQLQRIVSEYHTKLFRSVAETAAESFSPMGGFAGPMPFSTAPMAGAENAAYAAAKGLYGSSVGPSAGAPLAGF